jgi:hypothetical protein
MAITRPEGLDRGEFQDGVRNVVEWFSGLNPYNFRGSILKIEDVNYCLSHNTRFEPLYCWAVSAKRYALFNCDDVERPVLRKASAHGLGHLRAPYDESVPACGIPPPRAPLHKMGVELWQHDLWYQIVSAALNGHPDQVDLAYHPALNYPAMSRYAATTPKLLRWFKSYNRELPYAQQVKPFNFLVALQGDPLAGSPEQIGPAQGERRPRRARSDAPRPIAPFTRDPAEAARHAFDRDTAEPVRRDALKTYAQAVAQYHINPEPKFLKGDYLDRGTTQRRHIRVSGIRYIGKEANRLEEQFYLGPDDDGPVDYGSDGSAIAALRSDLDHLAKSFGHRELASRLECSRQCLANLLAGRPVRLTEARLRAFTHAASKLMAERKSREKAHGRARSEIKALIAEIGLKAVAGQLEKDASNLLKIARGKRPIPATLLARMSPFKDSRPYKE